MSSGNYYHQRNNQWSRNPADYQQFRRKEPECTCTHTHKVTIAIHNGEIEVLGQPKRFELTVLNLDKELGLNDDDSSEGQRL